jgi:Leucine-rich repeat (LRR) protein
VGGSARRCLWCSPLGCCASTESLFLYNNSLTGTIPDFAATTALSRLQLQFNSLASTIPGSLFANTGLTELRIDYNDLSGTIPSLIGNLAGLADLRLAGNALSGTLPEELFRLSTLGTSPRMVSQIAGDAGMPSDAMCTPTYPLRAHPC